MIANQELTEAQKEELAAGIKSRTAELEAENKAKDELSKKIAAMEAKVLGQDNVIDRTSAQEIELEKQRKAMAEARNKEREMQRKLQQEEEQRLEAQVNFSDKQSELDAKSKKLKKAYSKLQAAKTEIEDLQEEFANSREELFNTTTELQRELKLREMIIEHFIPPEEVEKVRKRVDFDQEYVDCTAAMCIRRFAFICRLHATRVCVDIHSSKSVKVLAKLPLRGSMFSSQPLYAICLVPRAHVYI